MYTLSEAAASDIDHLLEKSITEFGAQQTEAYYQSLSQCLELLGDNPEMGNSAEDVRPGYRRFPHESHVIFYRVGAGNIHVVRILHKRMDAPLNLQD
ncbi:MAG: type II toxin-antitoxin system RelE/ParE family toxin [Xanthomonadaceae bacterium]|nr:type II toxin-antitoxin system RelE/ParE family toxin [Xanthomonadaceae bacterium]